MVCGATDGASEWHLLPNKRLTKEYQKTNAKLNRDQLKGNDRLRENGDDETKPQKRRHLVVNEIDPTPPLQSYRKEKGKELKRNESKQTEKFLK